MSDVTWGYPDGTKVTIHDDGSITFVDEDGTTEHHKKKTGVITRKKKDGTLIGETKPKSIVVSPSTGRTHVKHWSGEGVDFPEKNDDPIVFKPPSGKWKRIRIDPKTGVKSYEPRKPAVDKQEKKTPDTKDGKKIQAPKEEEKPKSGGGEGKPEGKPKKKATRHPRRKRAMKPAHRKG